MIKKFTVLLVLAIMFCALPITTNAESYNEEFYNEIHSIQEMINHLKLDEKLGL